jgi:ABC-type transport system involved in cytochrome c biogenesis permease subunit
MSVGTYGVGIQKKLWALITWLVFATYLHADHKGWKVKEQLFWVA